MEDVREAPVPAWFWIVAVLATAWEALGCYQYLTQVRSNAATMPAWLVAVFAVAVWVGLFGAILLLMRRSWARLALIVSLVAVLIQFGSLVLTGPIDLSQAGLPVFVAVVAVLLVWFASHAGKRGWLR